MDNKQRLKLYYTKTAQSVEVAKQISTTLDAIRQQSLSLNYEQVSQHNAKATELSAALRELHNQRRVLAKELGCCQPRFASEMIARLTGNTAKALEQVTEALHQVVLECQNKSELHTNLVIAQQQVIHQAVDSLRVKVSA